MRSRLDISEDYQLEVAARDAVEVEKYVVAVVRKREKRRTSSSLWRKFPTLAKMVTGTKFRDEMISGLAVFTFAKIRALSPHLPISGLLGLRRLHWIRRLPSLLLGLDCLVARWTGLPR
jgi:hypothetical protein